MFYDNKYRKWYFMLIEAAKSRKQNVTGERHHIVPRCMGGNDDNDIEKEDKIIHNISKCTIIDKYT